MEYLENNYEAVKEYLENLDDNELMYIHREYCQNANYVDDEVWNNDEEFFEVFFPSKTMDAIRATSYGEYNFHNNFVKFDGSGNLESADNVSELLDIDELTDYILENPDEFSDYIEFEETDEEE